MENNVPPAEILVPPFYGTSEVLRWQPGPLIESIDVSRLFKGYWAGGNLSETHYTQTCDEIFRPAFVRLKELILSEGLLDPKGIYGFFSVYTKEETLYILNPNDFHSELASFHFPQTPTKGSEASNRSIADYFQSQGDVIAIQAVTIGAFLGDRARTMPLNDNRYSDGFFLNGIGNFLTEDLARRVTTEIRRGLFLEQKRGKRYSFGYPGLPGLEDQVKLLELLGADDRLDISLTAGHQMQPQHTAVGIFVHHPQARYF
jgi:5-methyltetrahydrofolate--homocysteine methyltransferase